MSDDDSLDPQEISKRYLDSEGALKWNQKYFRWTYFKPNQKQKDWCNLGGPDDPQARAFQLTANSQGGKSTIGAYALACHILGRYPLWWTGRKFLPENRPNLERPHSFACWLIGADATSVRSVMVQKLLGGLDKHTLGTGMIPLDRILHIKKASRPSDSLDEAIILRDDGTTASISCRFYTQERAQLQGATLDVAWMDEDPGPNGILIFGEIMLRLARTGPGLLLSTQTPMHGPSFMVKTFEENRGDIYRIVRMQLSDCTHMSKKEIEAIRADIATRPWEQEAREFGRPSMGMGNVFQTPEDEIKFNLQTLMADPKNNFLARWPILWGADFNHGGTSAQAHPAGWALAAINPHNGAIHIIDAFRTTAGLPTEVVMVKQSMNGQAWQGVPITYGTDGGNASTATSGETIASAYRLPPHNLNTLREPATWDARRGGGRDYEAGIVEMRNLFANGGLKIADHLTDVFKEYRSLVYKDNRVNKEDNDILDAIRFIVMARREARILIPGGGSYKLGGITNRHPRTGKPMIADGANPDPWGY